MVTESEFPDMQRASAFNLKPNGKAPMSLRDLEVEASEKEMQLAIHLSREEAEKKSGVEEKSRNCREKEAAGRPWS